MRSIEKRFNNAVEKNPNKSSYICFAEAIKGQGFSKQAIHRWFPKLVDKNDYNKKDKRVLIQHLVDLSKYSCGQQNLAQNLPTTERL